ncbi:hypothetical protein DPMN_003071 [Dreissena polymorpha]|uniref:Uncharacterized protein n=1 Tax=Dreissena polymorpha TaxID=45954 RepID=A0A9D4MNJ6_DREPO|nr:hypothetical protein DPMN_003071 [Dreissena polymorpha]
MIIKSHKPRRGYIGVNFIVKQYPSNQVKSAQQQQQMQQQSYAIHQQHWKTG